MIPDHDDSATAPPEWALRVAQALERRRVPSGPDDYRTPEQIEEAARLIASVAGEGAPERHQHEPRTLPDRIRERYMEDPFVRAAMDPWLRGEGTYTEALERATCALSHLVLESLEPKP